MIFVDLQKVCTVYQTSIHNLIVSRLFVFKPNNLLLECWISSLQFCYFARYLLISFVNYLTSEAGLFALKYLGSSCLSDVQYLVLFDSPDILHIAFQINWVSGIQYLYVWNICSLVHPILFLE